MPAAGRWDSRIAHTVAGSSPLASLRRESSSRERELAKRASHLEGLRRERLRSRPPHEKIANTTQASQNAQQNAAKTLDARPRNRAIFPRAPDP